MKNRVRRLGLAALVFLGLTSMSKTHAGTSYSTNDTASSFESQLSAGFYFNNFATLPGGLTPIYGAATPAPLVYTGSNLFSYILNALDGLYFVKAAGGLPSYVATDSSNTPLTITSVGTPINSIGLDVFSTNQQALPDSGGVTVTVTTMSGSVLTSLSETITTTGANTFVDFVTTGTIVSLSVSPIIPSDSATITNLVVGNFAPASAVPEPSSLLMLGTGALALGYGYRRKAAKARRDAIAIA